MVKEFDLVHNLKSIMGGNSRHQELEVAGHTVSTASKNSVLNASVWLAFSFLAVQDPSLNGANYC